MEHKLPQELPKELKHLISNGNAVQNHLGRSNAEVWYLKDIPALAGGAYLKIKPSSDLENLQHEATILEWLHRKFPVPKVHYYAKHGNKEFLLLSEIEGFDCSNEVHRHNPETTVKAMAEGLRLLHSLDIKGCPFNQSLSQKLKKAQHNVECDFVDEDDFEPEYFGKTANELYALTLAQKPSSEDLVFTHGDYCLPNIIIKDHALSGFIDLGRAGIADRYQDLALAIRSLRHNLFSEKWVQLFLKHYGLVEVDSAKMDFYILLDEFF